MTALEMLRLRCGFEENPPQPLTEVVQALPEDIQSFFREADGGIGRICENEPVDLVLYRQQELKESRKALLEEIREEYCCWVLLLGRDLNPEEEELLKEFGTGLTVLGHCGDPERPDYLCCHENVCFLADGGNLEDLLRQGGVLLSGGSYTEFLDRVLRQMELERLEWLEE